MTPKARTLKEKAELFLKLHHNSKILVLPNAWDAMSAILIERAGFPAMATTSAGVAFARGYPDGEAIPRPDMIAEVARIAALVEVPVSADLEAGYGPRPEDVAETVRAAIGAGAVGCNIEDGTGEPKEPLRDFDDAIARVRAGRAAADAMGIPFVLNARTDVYWAKALTGDAAFEEAVRRCNAFLEAGARSVFIPFVTDPGLMARLAKAIKGPLNMLAGAASPSAAEMEKLGVARITIGGSLARACYKLVERATREMKEAGTFGYARESFANPELNAMIEHARQRLPA